jgi:hypothetical protein
VFFWCIKVVSQIQNIGDIFVGTEDRKTWVGRFSLLSPWFSDIIASVKRDCKSEHLRIDPLFVRQNFGGSPLHRITTDEMRAVYLQHILSGNEKLAEFIANRWLFRNMELYRFFESSLQKISPEFEKISELPNDEAEKLLQEACERYGVEKVFCFATINEVAFSEALYEKLQREALEKLSARQGNEKDDDDDGKNLLRLEMDRLKERHEKKVTEMTRKHQIEVSRLTREIADLKRELSQGCETKSTAR